MPKGDFVSLDPFVIAEERKREREAAKAKKQGDSVSPSVIAALSDAQPQATMPESPPVRLSPSVNAAQSANAAQPEDFAGSVILPDVAGFLKMPNYILDHLPSVIGADAFMVYLRLYRLSFGFQKTTCLVSVKRIAEAVGISERSVQRHLGLLERRGLVRRVPTAMHYAPNGNEFEVLEPITTAALAQGDTVTPSDTQAQSAALADNKRTKKDSNKLLARYERLRDGNTITSDSAAPIGIRLSTLRGLVLRAEMPWDETQGRKALNE